MPTLLLSGYSSLGHSLPKFDFKTFRQPSRLPALVSTTFQVFKENNHLPALRITPQPYTDVFWMPAPMLGLISSGRQRLMLRMEHAPDTPRFNPGVTFTAGERLAPSLNTNYQLSRQLPWQGPRREGGRMVAETMQ